MIEENINDLELNHIDFQWVEKQTKPNFLKRALKLLELDGNNEIQFISICCSFVRWIFS